MSMQAPAPSTGVFVISPCSMANFACLGCEDVVCVLPGLPGRWTACSLVPSLQSTSTSAPISASADDPGEAKLPLESMGIHAHAHMRTQTHRYGSFRNREISI